MKWIISDEDIAILAGLVSESKSGTLKAALKKALGEIENEKIVSEGVCIAIDKLSILNLEQITKRSKDPKTQDLKTNFYLSSDDKRSLSNYFNQILLSLGCDKKISPSQCEELETFEDCTTLILDQL